MSLIVAQPTSPRRDTPLSAAIRALSWKNIVLAKFIWLDFVERAVLVTLFSFFAAGMIPSIQLTANIAVPLLLISEVLPVILVVCRKWSKTYAMSASPSDWILAFVGANVPFMSVAGEPGTIIAQELCSLLILSGLLIQISAKLCLWRSFGIVAAVREVKVSGPYRIVRHPMYAGYTIVHIGFLVAFPSFWNFVVYSSALLIQIARLLREEHLLDDAQPYREYSSRVRYRLLPGVF